LTYSDPKNLNYVRGEIDLKDKAVSAKIHGKSKDNLEILTKEGSFLFKEMHKGD
jgi:hypothetical protein